MRIALRPPRRRALTRLVQLVAAFLFAALLLPGSAQAAGSVTLGSREPTEVDGKWKLNMTIDFGGVPHLPHIPMLFVFTPTMLYERTLTDKSPDKPVLTRMPLQNQQGINESLDVGFSDASGKIFKITKFDFVIRRDHGFEAGEYDLQIKRADDGVQMGQTIKLTLKGDNVVVDRRAIMFTGEKKPKKADAEKKDEPEKKDEASPPDGPASDGPPKDAAEAIGPAPVAPKQGGCGCELVGQSGGEGAAIGALIFGLSIIARRRARRAS
ncbi:MAG: hypothetical protein ABI193_26755 [Minicystis sp.]